VVTAANLDDTAAAPDPVRLGGPKRLLRVGHCAATGGREGLGEVANPLDRGADVWRAEPMPALERGPRADHGIGESDDSIGDDSSDAQPTSPQRGSSCFSLPKRRVRILIGQTLSFSIVLI
jgi:hypothetical protein